MYPSIIPLILFALSSTATAVTCNDSALQPVTAASDRYSVDSSNEVVTDNHTGLMWKLCSEGQSGSDCATGSEQTYTWQGALQQAQNSAFAGYDDWRLPSIKELLTLVETCRTNPSINTEIFPATRASYFWSSSPYALNSVLAWRVDFGHGYSFHYGYRDNNYYVRLVRSGQ